MSDIFQKVHFLIFILVLNPVFAQAARAADVAPTVSAADDSEGDATEDAEEEADEVEVPQKKTSARFVKGRRAREKETDGTQAAKNIKDPVVKSHYRDPHTGANYEVDPD
jgi:hypothetical protein